MSRVGQFFGKLFAGSAGKQDLVLRAYGKLPFYAEYRRLEVAPGAPTVFSQWLDEGRLTWVRATPDAARGRMRTTRLVLRWSGLEEWVVATVWDSRDNLGRLFPFTFFVTGAPAVFGEDRLQRLTACFALHELFDELHAGLHALASGGDFYRLYRQQALPARPADLAGRVEALRDQASRIAWPAWFEAAELGDAAKPERRGPGAAAAWLADVRRRAERWAAQPGLVSELALSCPLARDATNAAQALLWLEWTATWNSSNGPEPCLMIPAVQASGPARMQVIFRQLLPSDFQLLTTDAGQYGYVENLGPSSPGAISPESSPDPTLASASLLEALTTQAARDGGASAVD